MKILEWIGTSKEIRVNSVSVRGRLPHLCKSDLVWLSRGVKFAAKTAEMDEGILTPKYLNPEWIIQNGKFNCGRSEGGMLRGKHSLFCRLSLYPEKEPNSLRIEITNGIAVAGFET